LRLKSIARKWKIIWTYSQCKRKTYFPSLLKAGRKRWRQEGQQKQQQKKRRLTLQRWQQKQKKQQQQRVEYDSEDIHDIPLRRLSKYSASLYDIGCEGISAKLVLFLGRRYIPSIDGVSGVSGSPIFCAIGLSNTAAPDVQGVLG